MSRETRKDWLWRTKDEIKETDASRWAVSRLPVGHLHRWDGVSSHHRSRWFGGSLFACGALSSSEGALAAWHLDRLGDSESADQTYREYQQILSGKSAKSLAVHCKEVEEAIMALNRKKRAIAGE